MERGLEMVLSKEKYKEAKYQWMDQLQMIKRLQEEWNWYTTKCKPNIVINSTNTTKVIDTAKRKISIRKLLYYGI